MVGLTCLAQRVAGLVQHTLVVSQFTHASVIETP